jgi:hypothetical protein
VSWLDEFDEQLAALDAQALRRRRRAVRAGSRGAAERRWSIAARVLQQ